MNARAARAAVVTGASRGAGRAIARSLARAGFAVGLLARPSSELGVVASEVSALGSIGLALPADLRDEADVRRAFALVRSVFGGLDVVVLNAATSMHGPTQSYTLDQWRATLDTNLTGPFLCAREAIPLLRARGGGHLIAIGSGAGKQGYAGMAAYSASKFGLIGLMQSLAAELGDEGIKASTIVPGSILTDFGGRPAQREPGRKYLAAEDVADAVLYLVRQSPQAWTQELNLWPFQ